MSEEREQEFDRCADLLAAYAESECPRLASRVERLENLLRGGLAYVDGGWDSKEWKALVEQELAKHPLTPEPQSTQLDTAREKR